MRNLQPAQPDQRRVRRGDVDVDRCGSEPTQRPPGDHPLARPRHQSVQQDARRARRSYSARPTRDCARHRRSPHRRPTIVARAVRRWCPRRKALPNRPTRSASDLDSRRQSPGRSHSGMAQVVHELPGESARHHSLLLSPLFGSVAPHAPHRDSTHKATRHNGEESATK